MTGEEKPEQIDEKKLDDIWDSDLLGRRVDANFIESFLTNRVEELSNAGHEASYILNVDAEWGKGKTFLMERLTQQLKASNHWAIYINAWESDHAADPLLAVVADIDKFFEKQSSSKGRKVKRGKALYSGLAKAAGGIVLKTGSRMVARQLGIGIEQIIGTINDEVFDDETSPETNDNTSQSEEAYENETDVNPKIVGDIENELVKLGKQTAVALISEHRVAQNSIIEFRNKLESIVKNGVKNKRISPPLFILVDELDRCRPMYAIQMLERVKHLFNVEGVVFIIATDSKQLGHSIRAVYGSGFDGERYLRRFFNRRYILSEVSIDAFIESQFAYFNIDQDQFSLPGTINAIELFEIVVQIFNLSLRDVEQCFEIFRSVISTWPYGDVKIELAYLFPLIAVFQTNNLELSNALTIRDQTNKTRVLIDELPVSEIEFKHHGPYAVRGTKTPKKSLIDIVIDFTHFSFSPLNKISENDPSDDPYLNWIIGRFSEEFLIRYNRTHYPDSPNFSCLRNYPALIQSALRIK